MKRKAHGAQKPRHINRIAEAASTAQRGDSPAQAINQRFHRETSGFTLLEVLVAMTILAVGIALGVSLISKAMGNIRMVDTRARIVDHANSVMELTLLNPEIIEPGAFDGDFEDGTRWTMRIEEYIPEAAAISEDVDMPVKLLAFTVEMFHPHSRTMEYRLRTLKLVPRQY